MYIHIMWFVSNWVYQMIDTLILLSVLVLDLELRLATEEEEKKLLRQQLEELQVNNSCPLSAIA